MNKKRGVTLIELLIAIALIGALSLGIWSIDLFSRYQLRNSESRARVENDITFVIEHITKAIVGRQGRGGAIGDINNPAMLAGYYLIDSMPGVIIWIDRNGNGERDGSDVRIAYQWHRYGDYEHQFWFYPEYFDAAPHYISRAPAVLSYNITNFNFPGDLPPSVNYLEAEITSCLAPLGTGTPLASCGAPENPSVSVKWRTKAPSMSVN